jgi:hypothetical protein
MNLYADIGPLSKLSAGYQDLNAANSCPLSSRLCTVDSGHRRQARTSLSKTLHSPDTRCLWSNGRRERRDQSDLCALAKRPVRIRCYCQARAAMRSA